ncbi:phytanoyl-CoA dioxygenase family protein [Novosphingobium sp.]|uniref:phytanoyl-CoA dioxygenase family protein n=1 Tax=Novosphingobium sp. TaxID=1874826 RepID=UPI0025CBF410|nr:phytanoyl-CoA dioxygenase family protein [Novosphingobium sp.]
MLVARHGCLIAQAIERLGAPPLAIEIEGAAWTIAIAHQGSSVTCQPGAIEGALVVTLTAQQFSELVQNQITFNGFLVARSLPFRGGSLADVSIWDSIWICLLEGWPVVGDAITFKDRSGAPLNLAQVFTPADDAEDIRHFLAEAGYLHLRGWLDSSDMVEISAEMDEALPRAIEGDGKSWWAQIDDGTRRCVRIQHFEAQSPTTTRILASRRWAEMVSLIACDDTLTSGQYVEALVKPVGVIAGPSDVSFHRDCHLGRHAYLCARRTVGIALTPTGGGNGSLRVIAGSHRLVMPVEIAKKAPYLPVVAVATEPGDLTIHLSCTLHDSTPPRVSERRVLYVEVPLAPRHGATETGRSAEELLREQVTSIHREIAQAPEGPI